MEISREKKSAPCRYFYWQAALVLFLSIHLSPATAAHIHHGNGECLVLSQDVNSTQSFFEPIVNVPFYLGYPYAVEASPNTIARNNGGNSGINCNKDEWVLDLPEMNFREIEEDENVACVIEILSVTPSTCDPTNGTYSLEVQVSYADQPSGVIQVTTSQGGNISVAQSSSPQTITLTGLTTSNAENVDVTAFFAADLTCTDQMPAAYDEPCCGGNSTVEYLGCQGDGYSIEVNGTTYNQANPSGIEELTNGQGCDSTITINLIFQPNLLGTEFYMGCSGDGYSVTVNGTLYDESNPVGTENLIGAAFNGCDSSVIVGLLFGSPTFSTISETLCSGESITVNGVEYNESNPMGTENLIGGSVNGCDSIVTINLSFLGISESFISENRCSGDGYSIVVNGATYDESNPTGAELLSNANYLGCDSLINIDLNFQGPGINNINETLCTGNSLVVNGVVYDEGNPTGTETIVGGASTGCDSIININLSFSGIATNTIAEDRCEGDGFSVLVNGTLYDESNPSGMETITGGSYLGCDSIITIDLIFYPNSTGVENYTGCAGDGYSVTVNGALYDEDNPSGTEILTNASGCDSTVTIDLVFEALGVNHFNEALCAGNSLVVNGVVYDEGNPTGTETIVGGASTGCDSIINVNLSFNAHATNTIAEDRCEGDGFSVLVNGTLYDESNPSGMETITGGSYLGCDSIITIDLIFYPNSTGVENYIGCAGDGYSVTVNGVLYDENNPSGTENLTNAIGCDSTVTIDLVFSNFATGNESYSGCSGDGYSVLVNGMTYNESNPTGMEILTGAAANGCDSVVTINLEFLPATNSFLVETLCFGESILVNGTIYNASNPSGTETLSGAAFNGCDSLVNIDLSFIGFVESYIDEDRCEGDGFFVTVNGVVYNEANPTGTETFANGSYLGCDSIVIVNLNFQAPANFTFNQTICEGETYFFNDLNLNAPGIYYDTLEAVNGCDSLVTMNLFVQMVSQHLMTDSICSGGSYEFAGEILNFPGTYYDTLFYPSGCDSLITELELVEKTDCEEYFDLALEKELGVGQSSFVLVGDTVEFSIKVRNEGDFAAYNILVIDYLPGGYDFVENINPGWVNFGAGPTWVYGGPLEAGDSISSNLKLIVNGFASNSNLDNYAEITAADDDTNVGNTPPTDEDSTPNAYQFDDPISEDDHDGVEVSLSQPILSLGNLVFADLDNNGLFGTGDEGLPNVEVVLFEAGADSLKNTADDLAIDSMLTDSLGEYLFADLEEGLYFVKLSGEGIPADYVSSTGDGVFDNDGAGTYEPANFTDNNVDNNDDGSQMGTMVMSDTIRLIIGDEPDGDINLTVDFGLYQPQELMKLGNQVFHDLDNDGLFNNADTGLVDVEVELYGAGADGEKNTPDDVFVASTVTNADGNYLFQGLGEGVFYVKLSGTGIPASYVSSTGDGPFDMDGFGPYEPFEGTDNNVDDEDDGSQMGSMVMSDTIRLEFNSEPGVNENLTVDFGLYQPQELMKLGNQIFHDLDNDGLFNNADTGMVDVEVELYGVGDDGEKNTPDDVFVASTITNADGNYLFQGLGNGVFYVKLSGTGIPAGYVSSTGDGPFDMDGAGPYEPFVGTDNDVDDEDDGSQMGSMFMSDTIRMEFNSEPGINENLTVDFGLYQPAPLASLGDLVWYDEDYDGEKDNDESGISGVTVNLFDLGNDNMKGGGDDNLVASTETGLDGIYGFSNLIPGDYYVQFDLNSLPVGYIVTLQNTSGESVDSDANSMGMTEVISLASGEDNPDIDMGAYQPMFDLALYKNLSVGQSDTVGIGDEVNYTIQVDNQGLIPAYNVVITDHLPEGMILSPNDLLWTSIDENTATYTMAGPIQPGTSDSVEIKLVLLYGLSNASLSNVAEIDSVENENGVSVTDIDSTPDNDINGEDDQDDETIVILEHDPTGYIYCEKTGQIITGGTIEVTGPNGIPNDEVQILQDGSTGYYEFYAIGAEGVYTLSYMHPDGFPMSTICEAQMGAFDPTGPNDHYFGSDATNGYISDIDCADNPYYLQFDLEFGDPNIYFNNLPIRCVYISSIVCEDVDLNDTADGTEPPFSGVTVNLYDCANLDSILMTDVTDANGRYRFDGLTAGDYQVQFVSPNNYRPIQGGPLNLDGFAPCVALDFGDCDTTTSACLIPCTTVSAGDDLFNCMGDSTQLLATPTYGSGSFTWLPSSGLSNPNIADPMALPASSTDYIVNFDDGLGCTATDTVRLFVFSSTPAVTYAPFDSASIECTEPIPFEAPLFGDGCDDSLTITLDSIILPQVCGYTIQRTWTATNDEGNSVSFVQEVIVTDNTPPQLTASHPIYGPLQHGDTLYADCTALPSFNFMTINAADNCSDVTVNFTETTELADCLTDGYLQRMYCGWTAVDTCGNMDSLYFTVYIDDNTAPVLNGVPADLTLSCETVPAPPTVTASDFCDDMVVPTFSENIIMNSTGCDSLVLRTWTVSDDCGNTSTATQTISVWDNEAPVITLTNPMLGGIMDGDTMYLECDEIIGLTANDVSATDNCCTPTIQFIEFVTAASCPDDGYIQFMSCGYVATDCCGNRDTLNFYVYVLDNTPPQLLNVPGDLALACTTIAPPPSTAIKPFDNCTNTDQMTVLYSADTIGTTIIRTWSATDECGNVGTATQTITFGDDVTPPEILNLPPDVTISCNENLPAVPVDVIAVDDCDTNPSLTFEEVSLNDCGGSVMRTWTAADSLGNSISLSQTITVIDDEAPIITGVGPDETYECDPGIVANAITVTDNCTPNPFIILDSDTTQLTCGYQIVHTYIATDNCGNETVESQTITITDTQLPSLSGLPMDITIECGEPLPAIALVTASDNCGQATVTFEETTTGSCPEIVTRTWTATDDCGNFVSDSQTITIEDTTPPSMVATHPFFGTINHGDTLYADCSQIASLDSLGFADSDHCSVPVRTFEENVISGNCLTDGYLELRYCGWTSTDDCGNTDSLYFHVIVSDNEPPVLTGVPADLTIECDEPVPPVAIVTANDNCSDAPLSYSETVIGSCPEIITRTWMATDTCGNTVSASQIITIQDSTPPTMMASHPLFGNINHGDTLYADCTQTVSLDSLGFSDADNCGTTVRTFEENVLTGTCEVEGYLELRYCGWTSTDECGNTDSLFFHVILTDLEPPVITGGVPADTTINCSDSLPIDNAVILATDNCDDTLEVSSADVVVPGGGDCAYSIERTWTVEDDCGNTATVSQLISVIDNEVPVLPEPVDTVVYCGQPIPLDTLIAIDNCDTLVQVTLAEVVDSSDCGMEITRTWTATDDCGNVSTVDQLITVIDTLAPEIVFNHPLLVGLNDGDSVTLECDNATIFGEADANVFDDCSAANLTFEEVGLVIGDCDVDGFITQMNCSWIATDACGNSDTITLVVRIMDSTPPEFSNIPNDILVPCGDTIPDFGNPTASDGCSNITMSFDQDSIPTIGGYDLLGIWTATDECGNENTLIQTITVAKGITVLNGLPSDTVIVVSNGEVVPPLPTVTAVDDCNAQPLDVLFEQFFEVSPNGCDTTFTNTWSAIGLSGDTLVAVQIVEVVDENCSCETPQLQTVLTSPATCVDSNGAAIIMLVQDESNYIWSWTPDIGLSLSAGNERTGLPEGTYSVVAESAACSDTFMVNIISDCDCLPATVDSLSLTTASCGEMDASATIHLATNPADYQYTWIPDLGTPNGIGNSRSDLPAAHYIVFITYNGNTDCLEKLEFDIFDDCPRCPPMSDVAEMNELVSHAPTSVCVPVPFGAAIGLDITLNGNEYTTGIQGCDNQVVLAYDYSTTSGMGQSGPFYATWQYNGEVFNTVVNNMDELAGGMDFVDPAGAWKNDTKSFRLISTNLNVNYGGLILYHIPTEATTYHGAEIDNAFMGSRFILPEGENEIIFANNSANCSTDILVKVELDVPQEQIFEDEFTAVSGDCGPGSLDYCLGFSELEINDFEIQIDGAPYPNAYGGCDWETTAFYGYGALLGMGAPPYKVLEWEVDGATYGNFTFETLAELLGKMNEWDTNGNWIDLPAQNSFSTPANGTVYGTLTIEHVSTSASIQMAASTSAFATSVSIDMEPGEHQLTITRLSDGLQDTIQILVACVSTDIMDVTIELDESGTICFDLIELLGDLVSIENLCATHGGNSALFDIDEETACVDYVGILPGTTEACFLLCDDLGVCDTMMLYVHVESLTAVEEVENEDLVVFNGFSPNGDGLNDFFKIKGLDQFPDHELTVFNRLGKRVFQAKNYRSDWGGSWGQNDLQNGTYYYVLTDGNGNRKMGYVQVKR